MQMDAETMHDQMRKRFASVATDPASEKRFGIGRAGAVKLGYDVAILNDLPWKLSGTSANTTGMVWCYGPPRAGVSRGLRSSVGGRS